MKNSKNLMVLSNHSSLISYIYVSTLFDDNQKVVRILLFVPYLIICTFFSMFDINIIINSNLRKNEKIKRFAIHDLFFLSNTS